MKILLSPAKQMKETENFLELSTTPVFQEESRALLAYLNSLPYNELKSLWKCSDKTAEKAIEQMKSAALQTPAILAYDGIAYKYMAPVVFDNGQFDYVQKHLCILSGLYGLLRPFDGIHCCRLEMQAKINLCGFKDLYAYWGRKIYDALTEENDDHLLIDLASKEYSSAVTPYLKDSDIYIQCSFYDDEQGVLSPKGVYCKMARGSMVRYMSEKNIKDPQKLMAFRDLGYQFQSDLSSSNHFIFTRRK